MTKNKKVSVQFLDNTLNIVLIKNGVRYGVSNKLENMNELTIGGITVKEWFLQAVENTFKQLNDKNGSL